VVVRTNDKRLSLGEILQVLLANPLTDGAIIRFNLHIVRGCMRPNLRVRHAGSDNVAANSRAI